MNYLAKSPKNQLGLFPHDQFKLSSFFPTQGQSHPTSATENHLTDCREDGHNAGNSQ
jgi:hypothetical protein